MRKKGRRLLQVRGLRKRWMLNAVLPILVLVVIAGSAFVFISMQYRFSSMRTGLESRAALAADAISGYRLRDYNEYYQMIALSAETFDEKENLELQFINLSGKVQVSSYGLTAGLTPGTADITQALTGSGMGYFRGKDPHTGEQIIAVSRPLAFNDRTVGVLRYVSSLRLAMQRTLFDMIAALAVGTLCLVLTVTSNALFIRKVVEPVAVVSEAAKRISGGSYGTQVENHYRDELGELVDNINDMSHKIGQAEKLQQEFISSVSHELRTPLTAINGWAETLLSDTSNDTEQISRGLGIILKESRRLTTMVEELLDFTKMQEGRFTLCVEQSDLVAELEDTVYTYRELFRQEGIAVDYICCEDPPLVTVDIERMKQVFCNVLDNAAKHGGAGKKIAISVSCDEENLRIVVRDYGAGIPEEELPHVKEKFYKGSSKARGSGIGLAVCDEILNLHNGSFMIANAEGGGAVVTMRIPLDV